MARKDSDDDKMNDQPDDNSADNFGLPDIEFKPLDETAGSKPDAETDSDLSAQTSAMEERPSESTSADSYAVDESKSKAPIILGVVIVLVVIIAGYLIYDFVYKPKAAEAARKAHPPPVAVCHTTVAAGETQERHEPLGQSGVTKMGFETQQVARTRWHASQLRRQRPRLPRAVGGDHNAGVQFGNIARLVGNDAARVAATGSRQRHDTGGLAHVDSRTACLVDEQRVEALA